MKRKDREKLRLVDNEFRSHFQALRQIPQRLDLFALNYFPAPFSKRLDLKVVAGNVDFNKSQLNSLLDVGGWSSYFISVQRFVFTVRWTGNFFDVAEFGADPAYATGIHVHYKFNDTGIALFDNLVIQDLADLSQISYDASILRDDKNPKENIFVTRTSFNRFSPSGLVLDLERGDYLRFEVNDDLSTSLNSEISVRVQGYAYLKG